MTVKIPNTPLLSIVVPVLNEAETIRCGVERFRSLEVQGVELVFVDGGSSDETVSLLEQASFKVVTSPTGRANQMNAGASCTNGSFLLFLHVDTYLEVGVGATLVELHKSLSWGFFTLKLDRNDGIFTWIAKGINWRSRVFKVATGDQAIFVRRALFDEIGKYKNMPLMEDIDISRRLKAQSEPTILPLNVVTSSRRWQARGPLKTILLMWWIQLAYKLGVSPNVLKTWYL